MTVDYLLVGQGICGTLLSHSLIREGKSVIVIDDGNEFASSRVASGIINPVTGKRLVRTWMIEELFPFAHRAYINLGMELGRTIVRECDILDFHPAIESRELFIDKLATEREYLSTVVDSDWDEYFSFNYGIGKIAPCLLVDIRTMLRKWRANLISSAGLLPERFSWEECKIAAGEIRYKYITAGKLILCNGAAGMDDPWFSRLPWSKDKGEVLIASIPGLPQEHIYKQGIHIVHWQDDLFWIGATHDWKYTDMQLTPTYRQQVEEQLNYWLKLPYRIVGHMAAQRPTNFERKPFVGLHPLNQNIGIFNGMGTKGCSMAPYFATMFARHLVHNEPLQPDVDVNRFKKILSK